MQVVTEDLIEVHYCDMDHLMRKPQILQKKFYGTEK